MRPAFVLGFLLAAVVEAHGQAPGYAAPGRLVDMNGGKLHIHCTGSGSPTVILEGGGGAFAIDWALVQPRVAETIRVCCFNPLE
jgi:hypothetical protein